jgi:hypothetical protein
MSVATKLESHVIHGAAKGNHSLPAMILNYQSFACCWIDEIFVASWK